MESYDHFETVHVEEQNFSDMTAKIIYYYLFQGLSVKDIETSLFGFEEFHGNFSKAILNFYGISTSRDSKNRGLYKNESPREVALNLLKSDSISENKVGKHLYDLSEMKNQISKNCSES